MPHVSVMRLSPFQGRISQACPLLLTVAPVPYLVQGQRLSGRRFASCISQVREIFVSELNVRGEMGAEGALRVGCRFGGTGSCCPSPLQRDLGGLVVENRAALGIFSLGGDTR